MLLLRNVFAQRLPAMFFDYTAVGYLHACFYFVCVCVCLFPFSSFHFPLIFPPLALSIIGLSILFLRLLGVIDSPVGGGGKPSIAAASFSLITMIRSWDTICIITLPILLCMVSSDSTSLGRSLALGLMVHFLFFLVP